jgi:hypothetical protein
MSALNFPTEVVESKNLVAGDCVLVPGTVWTVKRVDVRVNGDVYVTFENIDQARKVPAKVRIAERFKD